jgi:hypothetical protein
MNTKQIWSADVECSCGGKLSLRCAGSIELRERLKDFYNAHAVCLDVSTEAMVDWDAVWNNPLDRNNLTGGKE